MKTPKILSIFFALTFLLSSCSKEDKYFVTQFKINSFPQTQGSLQWDDTGGEQPDVFPAIGSSSGEVWRLQNYQTSHIEDATANDLPFTVLIPNVELDGETRYSAQLWDYDIVTSNELMASIDFTPEDLDIGTSGTEVTLSSGDASVTITIVKEEG